MLRRLKDNTLAVVDLSVVLVIGICFAALMVCAYIVYELRDQLVPDAPSATTSASYNNSFYSLRNITSGWDNAVNLLLIAITVFILAIAVAALLMLRGRQ